MQSGLRLAPTRARRGLRLPVARRSLPLFFLVALSLASTRFAGIPPADAAPKTYTLTFQASGQDMWNSGSQFALDYSQPWGASWNNSSSGGPGFHDITIPGGCVPNPFYPVGPLQICTPTVDLGTFGAEASASTDGTVSLQPHLTVRGGGVDVTYPVQITIGLPADGVLYPGDTYTISTSYVPNGTASLSTSSPSAQVTLDALLNAHFSSSATVQGGALGTTSGSLFDFSVGSADPVQIFNSDSPIFQGAVNYGVNGVLGKVTEGIVSGSFNDLAINTNGSVASNGTSLLATGEANFFNAQVDYTCTALAAAEIPCPEQSFSLDLGSDANFSANLQILDIFQALALGLHQRFQFDPNPKIHLLLSDGRTLDGNVGDTFAVTFPLPADNAASDDLTITPTFRLDNQFRNTTDLRIDPTLNLVPLNVSYSGSAGGQDLGSFSLQPLATQSITFPGQVVPETLFDQTFSLPGFDSPTGDPATVRGYVYPEPVLNEIVPAVSKPGATLHFSASGQNFVPSHANSVTSLPSTTALWNGDSRPSTLNTSTGQVDFDITGDQANTEGIFSVTVANPAPGGGTSNPKSVIIDGHAPMTTISLSGPQNPANNGWYKGDVSASLSSQDALSGVHAVQYQVDSGVFQSVLTHAPLGPGAFNAPTFPVSGDGTHTINYQSDDNAGNAEAQHSATVKIDGTPPAILGSRTPATGNSNGWNNVPVTVHFDCSDATSGVASCPSDTVLKSDGANQSVSGTSIDVAGNSASAVVDGINIDMTPPTVSYSGNAGTYTVDQQVNIACSSADNLSGIQSDTCQNIVGPAYSFPLGVNSFSATATDKAGNMGSGSTSFTVQVTSDSLCALVEQFVTDSGIANSLCVKLQNAAADAARGDLTAKSGIMAAFVNEVQAQSGQAMTVDQAAILTKLALAL